ncbi:MAG: hypothetical protein FWF05_00445 [Oscillospiraceae bacterium]|nr:hypothetical protein [Oscillospiraceae bacterium]
MKKTWKSLLAVILAASVLFGAAAVAVRAAEPDSSGSSSLFDYIGDLGSKKTQASLLNRISNFFINDFLLRAIAMFIPRSPDTMKLQDFDLEKYGGFYQGHDEFIGEPQEGNVWRLGYDKKSVLPDDFGTAKMKYARGSYVPWAYVSEVYTDDDGNPEFVGVRTIVLDDGSGRGAASFSVIDCIGLSNADVRKIRAAVADFAAQNKIVSINVSATHTHTGIDSQGVWTAPLSTLFNNVLSGLTFGLVKPKSGVNETYLNTIISRTTASIQAAYAEMVETEGQLYYAVKDISDYVHDRTPPFVYDGNLYRLVFEPFESGKKPTVIASLGCHPESASFGDEMPGFNSKITADCIYYMDKLISSAGGNFIFIQGNVGTVTSSRGLSSDGLPGLTSHQGAMRFGYELGYILLGMSESQEECAAINDRCGDRLGVNDENRPENYTVWYKDWEPVENVPVDAVLNIRHKQFLTEVQNNMAKVLAKAALANITMIYDSKTLKYYTVTEVGYMEIGDALKVFLSPGEIYGELLMGDEGGSMNAFKYPPLRELYGDNLIIFDLMNDAAGYVEPDNEYVIVGYRYNEANDVLESDSWALLVSMGKNAASDIIGAFIDLVDGVR